jgi:hypothetical protein
MWFSYDFVTSTVAVKSLLWLGILRDFQILAPVYSLFLSRHQQIDDKWSNHDTLQVALDQIYRMSAKSAPGCPNFVEN